ncbi:hypothetical protein DYB36_010292 [Aphanomyces astaci]|uniref:Uncharacterized protein n=1 Tax=Aphanomyces astaci TaxID=112090 RepID=A0A397B3C9_APHAT|nr:hypothetical protein DYB36_010292 [Aphanomyces astaci]
MFVSVETPTSSQHKLDPPLEAPALHVTFAQLFQYADTVDYVLMILGSIAAMATGVSLPLQMIFFGDAVTSFSASLGGHVVDPDAFHQSINYVVYQGIALGTVELVGGFGQIALWSISASRQAKRIRHAYACALLRQDIGWFDLHNPTTLTTQVADATLVVQDGMGRKVGECINFVAMAIAGFAIAFSYSWKIALVMVAFTPLIGLSAIRMTRAISAASQSGVASYAQAGGVAEESLTNIKTVQMLNAMAFMADKYKAAVRCAEVAGIEKGLAVGIGTGGVHLITLVTYAVAMYYGTVLVTNDRFDTNDPLCTTNCFSGGEFITAFFAVSIGAMALGQACPCLQAIATAKATASDMFQLMRPMVREVPPTVLDHLEGHIDLHAVQFAYPSRPHVPVCAGYSLTIPAGQKVALVGGSGSGKSTIVSLVQRFYDPQQGSLTLDGHDLKSLDVQWLRSQVGLVGQEPTLFTGSIADNIRHGKPNATMAEIIDAAKQATAYEFIMAFAGGFDTEVGGQGAQLSGGQKQRIAIARAIVKNPAVLLLDEATSALDAESERVVQSSLDRLVDTRQRTTIIVAHRLSTIRHADRIVVLSQGTIVEDGTHESLLAIDHGYYKELVDAQLQCDSNSDDERVDDITPQATVVGGAQPIQVDAQVESVGIIDAPQVSMSRLWAYSSPESFHLVLGSLGALVHGAMYPLWGVLLTKSMMVFFQVNLGSHGMRDEALMWSVGFVVLGVIAFGAATVQNHQFAIVCERLTSRVRHKCFVAMLHQDMTWFDMPANAPGALSTRLASDAASIRSMTAESLNAMLMNVAAVAVAFAVAFYYSWQLALVFVAVIPVMGAAYGLQVRMLTAQATKNTNGGDVQAGAILSEALHSIRTVASFNLQTFMDQQYLDHLQASAKTDQVAGLVGGIAYSASQALTLYAMAGILYYGGWLVLNNGLDFHSVYMVFNPVLFCSFGLGKAAQGLGDAGAAAMATNRLFGILDRQPTIDSSDSATGLVLEHVKGHVELEAVDFYYPRRPDNTVYSNYNLTILSGHTVALVGTSGSGKSTAMSLIQRFYDPSAGVVRLDGHDITTLNVQSLRHHIAIVGQEPVLFSGSVLDNICMGKPGASIDEIQAAAKLAHAHDFIMQFPDKYDTPVGAQGLQVSGGQKQRLAIARAILRDPAVLLLDEATSALDSESERLVQKSLEDLMRQRQRTTVIVAHRLSTVRNADVIAVVDGGKIVEKGSHDELIAIPHGQYAKLIGL